jgi:transposase InsO family protein
MSSQTPLHAAWAHLRFSIVGPLLAAPPPRGELKKALRELSEKKWRHPTSAEELRFAVPTIERWYYAARAQTHDPVSALRRAVRKDSGTQRALGSELRRALLEQYKAHPRWSYKLHSDNLRALAEADPQLAPAPSYSTVLRFMKSRGLLRLKTPRGKNRPGEAAAAQRLESREVRSYEVDYVGGLWHLDFHHSSRSVLTPEGRWVKPILLGILDDHSRLCCHTQWYLAEGVEELVHGLSQAIQKRGLPRALLSDNGSAMLAAEFREGLLRLGIAHETTLAYSPYQNGKQESFWGTVEGRLVAMLEGVERLSLDFLNEATQAWVELEYNRTRHDEIRERPIDRFVRGPDVLRPSPRSELLREAFRQDVVRSQRQSDGTVPLEGVRFEIPSRYRQLRRVRLRYARWNLGLVHLVDECSQKLLSPVFPLDKARNADGRRRALEPLELSAESAGAAPGGIAPLLRKLMADYASTGLPPAYLPKSEHKEENR